jgi:hypothetical protein
MLFMHESTEYSFDGLSIYSSARKNDIRRVPDRFQSQISPSPHTWKSPSAGTPRSDHENSRKSKENLLDPNSTKNKTLNSPSLHPVFYRPPSSPNREHVMHIPDASNLGV